METQNLPCRLTQTELDERRDQLAQLVRDHTQAEQAKKDAATQHKEKIDELEQTMSHVAREIREKAEYREVVVTRNKDIKAGIEDTIRTDTGEVIRTRALTPQEMQAQLFDASKVEVLDSSRTDRKEQAEG